MGDLCQLLTSCSDNVKRNWKIVLAFISGCVIGAAICFVVMFIAVKPNKKPSDECNSIENVTTTVKPLDPIDDSLIALSQPLNLSFIDLEDALNFTWSMADGLKTWEYYEVIIRGDTQDESVVETSDTESLIISDDLYCVVMIVGVRAVREKLEGPIMFTVRNAPAVTGLRANRTSESDHEFNLRWHPHPKEKSCGLEYKVFCRAEGRTTFLWKTEKTTVTLKTGDCNGEIMVMAVDNNGILTQAAVTSLVKQEHVN